MKAVVSLSGGLDSTTCLALAVRDFGSPEVMAVSFNYGQLHVAELEAARKVAEHYSVRHSLITLDPRTLASERSSLTGSEPMPKLTYAEISANEGVSPTYVPYRNGTFLSLAAALALQNDASFIYAGMHAEDARGWAYPDCTPEFIGAQAAAIYVGTYHKVRLVTPLEWLMKADIVKLGTDLKAPFELTLSCYQGTVPACGKCPTCIERLQAFKLAGLTDPIEYVNA